MTIDMSAIPVPDAVEPLNFETIFNERLNEFKAKNPEYSSIVESDPVYKLIEENAERELFLRQRVNDAVRAVLLASATGADLDNVAARLNVQRAVIHPGDPDAIPPVPPSYEPDSELRRRTQLALEGATVAGSEGSYIFHALKPAGVRDASVQSPNPCVVNVYVLGRDDDGTPTPEVLAETLAVLSASDVRPLTDQVTVHAPEIVNYEISATLYVDPGPAGEAVEAAAAAALNAYTAVQHRLGATVAVSGVHRAVHAEGVVRVDTGAMVDIVCAPNQAPYCTNITLTVEAANG